MEVGGIYHVLNRGVEKRQIFTKAQDYSRFILGLEFFNNEYAVNIWSLIARAGTVPAQQAQSIRDRLNDERVKARKPLVDLLGFALMPKHYQLIVREIQEGGTALFMKKICGDSTYFNKQNQLVGSLFQSRYKSVSINTDIQLANVFAYVHTNPVELVEPAWKEFRVTDTATAKQWLAAYRWSSYRDYIGLANFPQATQRGFFSGIYGKANSCRRMVEEWIEFKAENTALGSEIIE